jgi:CubicO group peptidase (beta-lactamase class C family)
MEFPPTTQWEYTSVDTLLLARMMSQVAGGGPAGFRRFAETELFAPIGMKNVTLEFDGAGTFIGSSHVYAPARAFARFGQLFLNDGVAADGRRVLPAGWAAYSRKSTLGSNYGSGFWTNDGPSEEAAWMAAHGFPKDGYFCQRQSPPTNLHHSFRAFGRYSLRLYNGAQLRRRSRGETHCRRYLCASMTRIRNALWPVGNS